MPSLVGTWKLVRFVVHRSGGQGDVYPFGEDAQGLILYGADGWMSAVLSHADRDELSSRRLESMGKAPDAEKAAAFETYLSYCGRWRLEGDEVVHSVEHALVPNIEGTELRRHWAFVGEQLVLSYEIVGKRGLPRTYELRWERG